MSGLYYAISIIAIFVVIRWFIQNDKKSPNEDTTGFLATRSLESQAKPSPRSATARSTAPFSNQK